MSERIRLTNAEFESLCSHIDREEFYQYFKVNSNKNVIEHFKLPSMNVLLRIVKKFEIVLTKEEAVERNRIATQQAIFEKYGVNNPYELESVKNKIKKTCLEKYGVDNPSKNPEVIEKIERTLLEKYGDVHYNNREKYRKTCLEKYGTDNPSSLPEIKEKIIKTNLEKYGIDCILKSEEYKRKIKETNLQKYGAEFPSQSNIIKDRIKSTNIERYGVSYFVMSNRCKNSYGKQSQVNIEFCEFFKSCGLDVDTEFPLDNYIYDFKIGNYLIEINPSITHNCSFAPHGNVKDKYYHQNKSITATKNGYRCIHLWDWTQFTDYIDLIYGIKNNFIPIDVSYTEPRKHYYNLKTNTEEFDNNQNDKNIVLIYDDGVVSTGI